MGLISKLLCRFGFHVWDYGSADYPFKCQRCGARRR